jgi:hypothetical protein
MELRGHTLRDQPLPEANITGMTIYAFILEVKKLELLAELVPQAGIIAMLRNPNAPEAESQVNRSHGRCGQTRTATTGPECQHGGRDQCRLCGSAQTARRRTSGRQ